MEDTYYYESLEALISDTEVVKLNSLNALISSWRDKEMNKVSLGEIMIASQLKRIADAIETIKKIS